MRSPGARPNLPVTDEHWREIVQALGLCERHAKIVELVLCDAGNPEIAAELGIEESTLKTYLDRIWTRTGTRRRMPLAILIWQLSLRLAGRSDALRSDVLRPEDI
jgi:DNA-binding NarL/FixJ family response regulator